MKRATLFSFAASGLLAVAAFAQPPAQKPANLPPGHPTVPAQNPNTLPPGHPSVPNQGQGQLPAGHPSVNGQAPTTRPAAKSAALIVRAFQGTKGAAAIGTEPVTVELWNQGKLLNKLEGKLDASGTSVFQNIPLDPPFQPLVKINHGGLEFSAIGDIMDPYHAGQEIGLQV